jgi:transposase, IS6 family
MRGLTRNYTTRVIVRGHAFVQNLRRRHYELGVEAHAHRRVAVACTELARTI